MSLFFCCRTPSGRRAQAREPAVRVRRGQILIDIPEGAIVAWVNLHGGVIAPPRVSGLGTRSFPKARLARHSSERVGWNPARISHCWINRAARNGISKRDVSCLIHSRAPHPPEAVVGSVGSLLIWRETGACGHRSRSGLVEMAMHSEYGFARLPN